jgi:hypothetical protein
VEGRPEIDEKTVPYLFSVRNMFLSRNVMACGNGQGAVRFSGFRCRRPDTERFVGVHMDSDRIGTSLKECDQMKRVVLGVILCIAGFSAADARTIYLQPQPAPGYYPAPPGYYPPPQRPRRYRGYAKPMGWGAPYPPNYQPDGSFGCGHRNYAVINGWCQRAW